MVRRDTLVLALLTLAMPLQAQVEPALFDGMKWRSIGPYRGGRSCAVSGVPGRPNEFYGGFTGGGVWKSTDAGVNWACVSDGYFKMGSVGAIAVSESNADTVVVGMGETEIRGNISPGDGVYRSDDGGKSWKHLGLAETQYISRVRIHPKDPNVLWVAALGPVYGASESRGVYKSTDGGKTWKKTLFVDDRSGAVDLTIDPTNPNRMFAATWTAWRTPYSLNSGGPGSKIFSSIDGGETWKDVSASPGLPQGTLGKIGIGIAPSNPLRIYAMIEAAQGGLYTSNDGGATWSLVNSSPDMRQRPWYYTRLTINPKNENDLFVLNVALHRSTDGGKSFGASTARHSDHHDHWIDANDPTRMISGNDGGVTVSIDNGRTWTDQDIPTAQFYHVSTDNAMPYRLLGAQQDNSTVRIPSRTFGAGIGPRDWTSTAGGESGYVVAKPDNPDIVAGGSYGGYLTLLDHKTGFERSINAWPENPMGDGAANLTHRFQWTFPILFSTHESSLMYTCSQFVLISRDLGGSWTPISPDLTRNDKTRMGPSGGPITKDNTSVEYYGTVFTLAESSKRRNLLWAGSDDGLIHVTRDFGKTWKNVTPKGMPEWSLVSMIDASPHNPGMAFVAVDNHENNDWKPYIYVTSDYGETWNLATKGIPDHCYVRVVREDPKRPGLLVAGTEFGMFISFDFGKQWQPFLMNLPIVPIHDLVFKDNDIAVATHGRSFWILDDISPIRQAADQSAGRHVLYRSIPGFNWDGGGGFGGRSTDLLGENPRDGLAVSFYFASAPQNAKLEMIDANNVVVATSEPQKSKGYQRAYLSPRYRSYRTFQGMRFWAAGPGPIKAPPGDYTLRLTVDEQVLVQRVKWSKDPRVTASDDELREQFSFSMKIVNSVNAMHDAIIWIRDTRTKIQEVVKDSPELESSAQAFIAGITEVEEAFYQTKARSGQDLLNYPIRLNNKMAALLGIVQDGSYAPTKQSYDVFKYLQKQADAEHAKLKGLRDKELSVLLDVIGKAGKKAPEIGRLP